MPQLGMIYVDDVLYGELLKVPKGERSSVVQVALKEYFEERKKEVRCY